MVHPISKHLNILAFVALTLLLGLKLPASETLTDDVGTPHTLDASPRRVVALAPELVELVYALGCEKHLVGRTQYATYPPQAEALPSVGTYIQPSLERLLSLRPDLVLATGHGNPREIVEKLGSLGLPVYTYFPKNIQELGPSIVKLGRRLGCGEAASTLSASLAAELATLKAPEGAPRPNVAILVSGDPLYAVGPGTLADDIIRWVGGQNVVEGSTRYPRIGLEWLLERQPDILVLAHQGGPCEPCLPAYWEKLPIPAARNGGIKTLDPDLLSRAGPRLLQAAAKLRAWVQAADGESRP